MSTSEYRSNVPAIMRWCTHFAFLQNQLASLSVLLLQFACCLEFPLHGVRSTAIHRSSFLRVRLPRPFRMESTA